MLDTASDVGVYKLKVTTDVVVNLIKILGHSEVTLPFQILMCIQITWGYC